MFLTITQAEEVLSSIRVVNDIVNFEHLLLMGHYPQCFFSFPYILIGCLTDISQHTDNISYGQITIIDSIGIEREVVVSIERLRQELNIPRSFRKLKTWIVNNEPQFLLLCKDKYPNGPERPEVIAIERVDKGSIRLPSKRNSVLRNKFGDLIPFNSYFD